MLTLSKDEEDKIFRSLSSAFRSMMKALFTQKGARLDINILASREAQHFIDTHASAIDSAFEKVEMSPDMRSRLQHSDRIFSGLKTFHELHEAFPSLIDESGQRKSFDRFLQDVQGINETYNRNYLRAEYNFAHASASMAARWDNFSDDSDRYELQYRTAGDDRVRPEHAELEGITLPKDDPFWLSYFPPNGWNCRCTAVQVRRGKYPPSTHDDAMRRGSSALSGAKDAFFRFNSGAEKKTFPDYNPYTIRRCRDCDIAKGTGTTQLAQPNEICEACKLCRKCEEANFKVYKVYPSGGKILIHELIDKKDSDYGKLVDSAEFFARMGKEVRLTPKMSRPSKFVYQNIYFSLMGTKFEDKCPDLNIDRKYWYEHEGFISHNPKNAFRNMMHDGLLQSNRIIVDRPGLTERYMRRNINARIKRGEDIQEVWIREKNGGLTLLYKKTDG